MTGRWWLKRDARNRAWRTILQGIAVTVLGAAGDAALQAVQRSLIDGIAGNPIVWDQVLRTAEYSAGTAALMALVAYVHRAKVDPSPIPSAQPPRPPGATEQQAPATSQP